MFQRLIPAGCLCVFTLTSLHAAKVIYHDDFETNKAMRVMPKSFNQPYDIHFWGFKKEANGNTYYRTDVNALHAAHILVAPRANKITGVSWGNPSQKNGKGSSGHFRYKSLGINIEEGKGYLVTVNVRGDKTCTPHTAIAIRVELSWDSPRGKQYAWVAGGASTRIATDSKGEWKKLELELSGLLEAHIAAGNGDKNLQISNITVGTFIGGAKKRIVYEVDEVKITELNAKELAAYRRAKRDRELDGFKFTAQKNDSLFPWGAYGDPMLGIQRWFKERKPVYGAAQVKQTMEDKKLIVHYAMMTLKQAGFQMIQHGGGQLFPRSPKIALDHIKENLDHFANYEMMLSPSTYVTRYYSRVPKDVSLNAMKRMNAAIGKHPALLAYHLVDEPEGAMMKDYLWGRTELGSMNKKVAVTACCNSIQSIQALAGRVPLITIDYYPIYHSKDNKGAWAVVEAVKYAKKWGAKRIWLLPQVFGGPSWSVPYIPEFYIQYFGGLAEGATGFYAYGLNHRGRWTNNRNNEIGNFFDTFGNLTELGKAKSSIAPLFISVGELFVDAERKNDGAAIASNSAKFQSNVGKEYDVIGRVVRQVPGSKYRLMVVWNNDINKVQKTDIRMKDFAASEKIMDLETFRTTGNKVSMTLKPGMGRIYAIGTPAELNKVKTFVLQKRIKFYDSIIKCQVRDAVQKGFNPAKVKAAIAKRDAVWKRGNLTEACRMSRQIKESFHAEMAKDPVIGKTVKALDEIQPVLMRIEKKLQSWKYPVKDKKLALITEFRKLGRDYMVFRLESNGKGFAQAANRFEKMKKDLLTFEQKLK